VPSTILLIDDEASVLEMLKLILEEDGYVIVTAANGCEALNALAKLEEPPAMILLDLMMPEMNGWQFFAALRADPRLRGIPVVVMTAYSRREFDVPDVEILRKPFDIPALRDATERCRQGAARSA